MTQEIQYSNASDPFFFATGVAIGVARSAGSTMFRVMEIVAAVAIAINLMERMRGNTIEKNPSSLPTIKIADAAVAEAIQVIAGSFSGKGVLQLCKGWTDHSFVSTCSGIGLMFLGAYVSAKTRQHSPGDHALPQQDIKHQKFD